MIAAWLIKINWDVNEIEKRIGYAVGSGVCGCLCLFGSVAQ